VTFTIASLQSRLSPDTPGFNSLRSPICVVLRQLSSGKPHYERLPTAKQTETALTTITEHIEAQPRHAFAMGLMVVSSIGISFGGLVLRSINDADVWQINFYRSLALVIVVTVIMLFRYQDQTVQKVRRIGRPGLFAGALLACAGIGFLQAITNTTVANTLFTLSAIPFLSAALAWLFLRETLQRSTLFTMLAAAIGVGVMMAEGVGSGSLYGNGMALATAVLFSSYAIVVRRNRNIDMLPALMVSGLLIILVSAVLRWDDLGISTNDLLLCLLLGGGLSGLANALFIAASRHLVAAELTLFMLLEFALGPIWVWIFINEIPTEWTIIGGGIVILSVTLRAMFQLRRDFSKLRRGRSSPI
jgi:drug/metabolite transporter (DMT)-like permease